MDDERRLIAIEEKIAHLEHYLGELDGVVRETNDRLDGFRVRLDQMRDLIEQRTAEPGDGDDNNKDSDNGPTDEALEDDRPPHW